ncbi:MAG: hypothetical protein QNL33_17535 [Akkermansiaceae bacterium]|jgi:hypothetical protein
MKLLLVKTCPLVGNLSALDHNNNGISDVWESRYPASAAEPSVEDDIEFLQGTNPRSLTDSDNNTLPIIAQNRFYRLTITGTQGSATLTYEIVDTLSDDTRY